jgi:broad specificity phosphatase PhoE
VASLTRIYLARHGQTVTNREGRFCGHAETALTPRGIDQARALGRRLSDAPIAACYTSDYSRAIETATLALGERAIPVRPDPDLRELHYGEWELERESAVRKRDPGLYGLMEAEDPAWRPPGGETVAEVRGRTSAALARIVAGHRGQQVLVISHGTAINCLLSTVLGMAETHVFRLDVANCALTEIEERRGRMYVVRLNDTAHLAGIA